VLFYAVILLFLLQLLTDFVQAAYAIGLLTNSLPPEGAAAAFLLSPFLLLGLPRRVTDRSLLTALLVAFTPARLLYPLMNETRLVLLVSGLGVASGMLLLPLLLSRAQARPAAAAGAFAVAVVASVALRAWGSGVDISTSGSTQWLAWIGLIPVALGVRSPGVSAPALEQAERGSQGLVAGTGIVACIGLTYLAFTSASLTARWFSFDYEIAIALLGGGLLLSVVLLLRREVWLALTPRRLFTLSLLLAAALSFAAATYQVDFPDVAAAYPLLEPDPGAVSDVLPAVALMLVPVPVLAFGFSVGQLQSCAPSRHTLAAGFGLGGLVLALLIFAQMFTTTYDYVPVVGPLFRDRFWLVLLALGAFLALPLAFIGSRPSPAPGSPRWAPLAVAVLGGAALVGAVTVRAEPGVPVEPPQLRIVSLNVQQGHDAGGERNLDGQLAFLRRLDADVIALHESDTARVANANNDLVRYFANGLDMFSAYGPRTVNGTFGIALLSRFPIDNAQTWYLYSEAEQTAAITARISTGTQQYNLIVTHLGNGGPMAQLEDVLSLLPEDGSVILMGDFNFRPDTPQYAATVALLDEAWLRLWPGESDGTGDHSRRIDYIFVTPEIEVVEATYADEGASNHPAIVVTIRH
jgi:endonuclease/exonuclease/phosphatase family metal-dependent hydrolase